MLLSVIVPVYNGENYLNDCLSSLIDQLDGRLTAQNYEILVVNDGSTDGTEGVIDSFVKDHPFIVKLNKENGGVSSARNLGIENAKGEFITFLDADDKFAPHSYSLIVQLMETNGLEGFCVAKTSEEETFGQATEFSLSERQTEMGLPRTLSSSQGCFYKKEILKKNRIFFDTGLAYQEDLLFNFIYLHSIENMATTSLPLYFYRKNEESATKGLFAQKTQYGDTASKEYRCYLARLSFLKKLKEYNAEHHIDASCDYLSRRVFSVMTAELLWFAMKGTYPSKNVLNDVKEYGLTLKDIQMKQLVGAGGSIWKDFAVKSLKFSFKIPAVYHMVSGIYRKLHR